MPTMKPAERGRGGTQIADGNRRSSKAVHVASISFGLLSLVGAFTVAAVSGRRLADDDVFGVTTSAFDTCAYLRNRKGMLADGSACFGGISGSLRIRADRSASPSGASGEMSHFGIQPNSTGYRGGADLHVSGHHGATETSSLAELLANEAGSAPVTTFRQNATVRATGAMDGSTTNSIVFGIPVEPFWESLWLHTSTTATGAGTISSRDGHIRVRRSGRNGKPSEPEILLQQRVSRLGTSTDIGTKYEMEMRSNGVSMGKYGSRDRLDSGRLSARPGVAIWGDGDRHEVNMYSEEGRVRCFQLEVGGKAFPFRCYRFTQ
jgi:hypothetical protein